MSTEARGVRRRGAGMLLGLFFLGGLLPEAAMAQHVGSMLGGALQDEIKGQYGTSRRVARRTSRRTSRRHAAAYGGGYGYGAAVVAAPVGVSYITTLPAGCVASVVGSITYQQCGAVRYRPYYQGDTLVYVEDGDD
ncbi:hypothetical protein HPC49_19005 [Pyxidicoccus fallax]|uniref:Uncharacterized protein n=1 Tax=Pyxidicoccus fallax TaxID=394095 RepID=A0A848L9N8_9BACT|nr:hypothetical protein [Pyxidicoccus fallax]NMO13393.1 hypothetical protein [Pyxidicoccus fallax]NPC80302.1 hypothetical protein [Pyxidicoccus fallax]